MNPQAQSEARVRLAAERREQRRSEKTPKHSTLKRVLPRVPRRAISPASTAQRQKVELMVCPHCGSEECEPVHVVDRSLTSVGQDDPRAVIPGCREMHRAYDDGNLSLLEFLEPHFRQELAFAVERIGLLSTLRRVTKERDPSQISVARVGGVETLDGVA